MEWLQPLIEKQAFLYLLGRWNIFTQDSHQTLGLSIEKGLINRERGWWLLWMGPCLSLNWTGVCVCVWWIIGPCLLPVKLFPVLVPSNGVDWCLRVVTEKAHDWNASPEATVLVCTCSCIPLLHFDTLKVVWCLTCSRGQHASPPPRNEAQSPQSPLTGPQKPHHPSLQTITHETALYLRK